MAFNELTEDQSTFMIRFMELIDTGNYEPEFNAAGAINGWFILIGGKKNTPGLEWDGYSKTLFEALADEGYLTISYQSQDSFIASPKKKAYDEYAKVIKGKMASYPLHANPDIAHNVFVVHGRNIDAKNAVEDFLRKIDLRPIEWSEARSHTGKANPFSHEIVEAALEYAQAIIVLLTPEDMAQLHPIYLKDDDKDEEKKLVGQPRQNVIFELGMAMGRDEQRTLLVQIGRIRGFTDIEGRHTIRMDNTGQKRHELAQRLIDAGCKPNLSGDAWLNAGDFSLPDLTKHTFTSIREEIAQLNNDQVVIMRAIVDRNTKEYPTRANDISKITGINLTRCGYHLDVLKSIHLIKTHEYVGTQGSDGDWHFLTESGRKYMVENNLV